MTTDSVYEEVVVDWRGGDTLLVLVDFGVADLTVELTRDASDDEYRRRLGTGLGTHCWFSAELLDLPGLDRAVDVLLELGL